MQLVCIYDNYYRLYLCVHTLIDGIVIKLNGIIDGIVRVSKEEGLLSLWRGSSMVVFRAVLMTIGYLLLLVLILFHK
jgi:hypothetical protein